MRVDDCSTQRNLNEEGRGHATARLAFGRAEILNATVNPRAGIEDKPREVREMRVLATEKRRSGNVILVSHGTTITGAPGLNGEPGEMIVVTPQCDGHFELRGRLKPVVPAP